MSQPQTNLTIAAPGFGGLNTELAQTEQPDTFAATADNCVIDSYGRVGARKGFNTITTDLAGYGGSAPANIYEFVGEDGTTKVFSTAGTVICEGTAVPAAIPFLLPVVGQALSVATTERGVGFDTDGAFPATQASSAGSGTGFTADVIITGGLITSLTITANGSAYVEGEVITLAVAGSTPTTVAKITVAIVSTQVGAAVTDANWKMMSLNNSCYFVQSGHTPRVYDHEADTYRVDSGLMPRASCGISAFGRLWLADTATDNHSVVYYSTRLNGTDFDLNGNGDTGSFNCAEFWPTGYDEVQALAAHNGRLIIFGKDNILVYAQADGNPAATKQDGGIYLEDSIRGIGCISRDSIQSTGADVVFLDHSGLRSLARTIQEKSLPIGNVSANIRTKLNRTIQGLISTDRVRSVFIPEEQLYLLIGSEKGTTLAFSTAQIAQDGVMRVTRWPALNITSASTHDGNTLFSDAEQGIVKYEGYMDNGESYKMRYFTHFLSFGDSTKLKIPKRIALTMLTGQVELLRLFWAFDYEGTSQSATIELPKPANWGEYGIGEYGEFEYTGGINMIRKAEQSGGSGYVLQVGIEADILGAQYSLQEINIQTLIGRIV